FATGPPARPSIVAVDMITGKAAVLHGSAFSDPDAGDTHQASQWQVDLETGNFSSPKANTTSTSSLTSFSVGHLTPLPAYKARLRYQDSHSNWSPYSDPAVNPGAHFTTLGECADRKSTRL